MINFLLHVLIRLLFKFQRRPIFSYFDGTRYKSIDPAVALRAIAAHPDYNPSVHPKMIDAGDEEAWDVMIGAACDVFKCHEFDPSTGKGLTQAELMRLMIDFADYVSFQKKSTGSLPISPVTTEPLSSGATSPTNNDSDSPSISTDSSQEKLST